MRGKPPRLEAMGTKILNLGFQDKDQRERMKGERKVWLRCFLGIRTLAEPEPKHPWRRGDLGMYW